MILNSEVFAEVFEKCVIKLSSIVRYQYSGYPKFAHNVFPNEVLDILLSNIC